MAPTFEAPKIPLDLLLKSSNGAKLTVAEKFQIEEYTEKFKELEQQHQTLGLVDLGEIMEAGITEPQMLVPELIMEGVHHLVYGKKESAKTWLLLQAAVQLMLEDRNVLWVDQEMGRTDFARRLMAIGLPPELVSERFVYSEFAMFDLGMQRRALWSALLDHYKPALVIVDAHTEVLATADLNENSGTDTAQWHMAYMAPVLARGGTTAVIDHTGHTDDDRARGSGHKGAQSKIELAVSCTGFDRDHTGTMTVVRKKNTPAAPIPEKQTYEVGGDGNGGFIFRSGTAPLRAGHRNDEHRQADLRKKILTTLHDADEPPSQTQLTGMVGGKKAVALNELQSLVADGLVEATQSRQSLRYSLTPQGEMWFKLSDQDQEPVPPGAST